MPTDVNLEQQLRLMRRAAPPTVGRRSLVEAGVADGYTLHESPLGAVFVGFNTHRGITACELAIDEENFVASCERRLARAVLPAEPAPSLRRDLGRAFHTGSSARLRFDLSGLGAFAQEVLRVTSLIPPGEVRSYAWVAAHARRPRAVRAAGTALARNPIGLLIPCHRVIRSDGVIGNYGMGGPSYKRSILDREGVDVERLHALAAAGIRFVGTITTSIYCYPSCRHSRRVVERNRVHFKTAADAQRAGYRPCRHCEPLLS